MRDVVKNWGLTAATFSVVAAFFVAAPTVSAEPPPLEAVENISHQVRVLEDTYLVPAVLESRYQLETRFNEAKVAYLLEDYPRASLLFVSIVDGADSRSFASLREAQYLLGDSLYRQRSFQASRGYFQMVVDQGPGPFYQASIVRILEIAAETGDYDGVDALYDRLDGLQEVSPAIHYVRGTTLYQQGRMQSARPWFQRAARDERYAFTARYFEGVTLAAADDLQGAEQIFEDLTRRPPRTMEDRHVVELALLALGRLAYERGEFEDAVDKYLQVPRVSDLFPRALFELTWALVAQGNYRAALRNLDILLISDPDPRFLPEAKQLMADMAMRLGEYDDARRWFQDLITTFTPVREELREFIDQHQDMDEFFVDLVRQELQGLRPEFLPELVGQWIDDTELMKSSRRLLSDGVMTQADIDEAYEALEEIDLVLTMGSSIEVFPRLAEGWVQGIEVEARLVDLEDQMLDWELRQVRPLLSASDERELAAVEEELRALQEREARVPRTRAQLQERNREITDRFRVLRQEIDRVAFEIAGFEELLEGIAQYMAQEADGLTQAERKQVEEIRQELRQEVAALEEDRRRLSRELDRTQRAFGARDDSLVRHRELRHEIQQLQAQRAAMVDRMTAQLTGEQRQRALEVARMRQRLPVLAGRLDDYFSEMDRLVEERIVELRATLELERTYLAQHQSDLDGWSGRSETTVAQVAMWNFVQIDEEFNQLVRRSHMGLVDVDWQRLEDARADRQHLVDEKMELEDLLREAFPDVR